MRSLDVIHSFFVPQFAQKEDIVPGLVTQLHITPTRLGTFPLECTELCGLGHSLMRSRGDRDEAGRVRRVAREQEKTAARAAVDHAGDDAVDLDDPISPSAAGSRSSRTTAARAATR